MEKLTLVEQQTKDEAAFLRELCEEMIQQFERKNLDYGNAFGNQFQKYGPIAGVQRLSDRFSRVEALLMGSKPTLVDETIDETLVDNACYSLMIVYERFRAGVGTLNESMKRDLGRAEVTE